VATGNLIVNGNWKLYQRISTGNLSSDKRLVNVSNFLLELSICERQDFQSMGIRLFQVKNYKKIPTVWMNTEITLII